MIPVIPWSITLAVLAGGVTLVVANTFLVSLGAARGGLSPAQQSSVRLGVALFLGAWLGLAILAAPSLASLVGRDPYQLSLVFPLFSVGGPLLAIIGYRSSSLIRRAVNGVPLPGLIGVQLFRTLGAVFLILLALGQLPAHFALPAGWGDIAVGMSAPIVAILVTRGVRWPALLWSVVGLADLAVAVGMGSGFATPLLPGVTSRLPGAAALGAYPMILVPIFAVPVAVLLHVVALRGLLEGEARVPMKMAVE